MGLFTDSKLVAARMRSDIRLIVAVFVAMLAAVTLISSAPIYISALERQSIRGAIDSDVRENSNLHLNLNMSVPFVPLDAERITTADQAVAVSLDSTFGSVITDTRRQIKSSTFSFSLQKDSSLVRNEGYFQNLSSLDKYVTYKSGRPPASPNLRFVGGPLVEASIATDLADFYEIEVGDVISANLSTDSLVSMGIKIVGVFEVEDEKHPFWQGNSKRFTYPLPDVENEGQEPLPYIAVFVQEGSLIKGVGGAFPGTVSEINWFNHVSHRLFREWSQPQIQAAIDTLEETSSETLPGSEVRTGIKRTLREFDSESFRSSTPLLLLMAVLSIGLFYFLFMLTTYLIPGRELDITLLKSRGISTWRLFGQYVTEGLFLTALASSLAPFLSIGLIASIGMLPYFDNITSGSILPVRFSVTSWLMSVGAGLFCICIFVAPVLFNIRTTLLTRHISSSRPPSVPFVQRYYLDLLFLSSAGIFFWEMKTRGNMGSGGIFGKDDINEALLVAPVLLLIASAMLFFRVFPMLVRFVAGESYQLAVVVGCFSAVLIFAFICRGALIEVSLITLIQLISSIAFVLGIWVFNKFSGKSPLMISMILLVCSVGTLWAFRPENMPILLYSAYVGVLVTIPCIAIFRLLQYTSRSSPVSISIMLWHLSRNPLQYSWLILLLVLARGIAVLSTTLGATLERSHIDRINYRVAEDARIVERWGGFLRNFRSAQDFKKQYIDRDDVLDASLAIRSGGTVGSGSSAIPFQIMAVETENFSPWSREDFALHPMTSVLSGLRSVKLQQPLVIPEGTTEIGLHLKPMDVYPLISIWLLVEDASKRLQIITLGKMGSSKWTRQSADVPNEWEYPLNIKAIQLSEPGFGATGTSGTVLIDSIYAVQEQGRDLIIDGFEDSGDWIVIPTSSLDADSLNLSSGASIDGGYGAVFEFGKETNQGVRGIRRAEYSEYLPVVASESFLRATGFDVGTYTHIRVSNVLIAAEIVDKVEFFPTMDPSENGFLVADFNSLISHLGAVSKHAHKSPNELFLTLSKYADSDSVEALSHITGISGKVMGKETMLSEINDNPLITAGWQAMAIVATVVATLMTGMGYLIFVVFLSKKSNSEMGSLRALGLSRYQTLLLVSLEHLVVVVMGLGLGAWTGFQMTRIVVASVAVTDKGSLVIPPPIITVDWVILGLSLLAFTSIFLFSVFALGKSLFSMNLGTLARTEE